MPKFDIKTVDGVAAADVLAQLREDLGDTFTDSFLRTKQGKAAVNQLASSLSIMFGFPQALIPNIIQAENHWMDPHKTSEPDSNGRVAYGYGQIREQSAKAIATETIGLENMNWDRTNPIDNIFGIPILLKIKEGYARNRGEKEIPLLDLLLKYRGVKRPEDDPRYFKIVLDGIQSTINVSEDAKPVSRKISANNSLELFEHNFIDFLSKIDGSLIINNLEFAIDPLAISSRKTPLNYSLTSLRTPIASHIKTGYSNLSFSVRLLFQKEGANSFNLLSTLMFQIRKNPIIFIENEIVRSISATPDDMNMAAFVLSVSINDGASVLNAPDTVILDLDLAWFNYRPFSNDFYFNGDYNNAQIEAWRRTYQTMGRKKFKEALGSRNISALLPLAVTNKVALPSESPQYLIQSSLDTPYFKRSNFTVNDYEWVSGLSFFYNTYTQPKLSLPVAPRLNKLLANNRAGDLVSIAVPGIQPISADVDLRVNAKIAENVIALVHDFYNKRQKTLLIVSAFRTYEKQKKLEATGKAAKAGTGLHETGNAMDFQLSSRLINIRTGKQIYLLQKSSNPDLLILPMLTEEEKEDLKRYIYTPGGQLPPPDSKHWKLIQHFPSGLNYDEWNMLVGLGDNYGFAPPAHFRFYGGGESWHFEAKNPTGFSDDFVQHQHENSALSDYKLEVSKNNIIDALAAFTEVSSSIQRAIAENQNTSSLLPGVVKSWQDQIKNLEGDMQKLKDYLDPPPVSTTIDISSEGKTDQTATTLFGFPKEANQMFLEFVNNIVSLSTDASNIIYKDVIKRMEEDGWILDDYDIGFEPIFKRPRQFDVAPDTGLTLIRANAFVSNHASFLPLAGHQYPTLQYFGNQNAGISFVFSAEGVKGREAVNQLNAMFDAQSDMSIYLRNSRTVHFIEVASPFANFIGNNAFVLSDFSVQTGESPDTLLCTMTLTENRKTNVDEVNNLSFSFVDKNEGIIAEFYHRIFEIAKFEITDSKRTRFANLTSTEIAGFAKGVTSNFSLDQVGIGKTASTIGVVGTKLLAPTFYSKKYQLKPDIDERPYIFSKDDFYISYDIDRVRVFADSQLKTTQAKNEFFRLIDQLADFLEHWKFPDEVSLEFIQDTWGILSLIKGYEYNPKDPADSMDHYWFTSPEYKAKSKQRAIHSFYYRLKKLYNTEHLNFFTKNPVQVIDNVIAKYNGLNSMIGGKAYEDITLYKNPITGLEIDNNPDWYFFNHSDVYGNEDVRDSNGKMLNAYQMAISRAGVFLGSSYSEFQREILKTGDPTGTSRFYSRYDDILPPTASGKNPRQILIEHGPETMEGISTRLAPIKVDENTNRNDGYNLNNSTERQATSSATLVGPNNENLTLSCEAPEIQNFPTDSSPSDLVFLDDASRNIFTKVNEQALFSNVDNQFVHNFSSEYLQNIFSQIIKKEFYNDKLSMRRAFPTFKLYIIDGDPEVSGRFQITNRFYDNWYETEGVQEIRITQSRKVAADLLYLKISDPFNRILAKTFRPNSSVPYSMDVYDADAYKDNQYTAPANDTAEIPLIRDGAIIQVRLGYENDPEELPIKFNGKIVGIEGENGVVTIIAQSFAEELTQRVFGFGGDAAISGDIKWHSDTLGIVTSMLALPEMAHFGMYEKFTLFPRGYYKTNPDGTRTQYRYGVAPENYTSNVYTVPKYNYINLVETIWNSLGNYDNGFVAVNQTPWDVIKEMELRHPGWIASPVPYGNRMTMFFGVPSMPYFYRDPASLDEIRRQELSTTIAALYSGEEYGNFLFNVLASPAYRESLSRWFKNNDISFFDESALKSFLDNTVAGSASIGAIKALGFAATAIGSLLFAGVNIPTITALGALSIIAQGAAWGSLESNLAKITLYKLGIPGGTPPVEGPVEGDELSIFAENQASIAKHWAAANQPQEHQNLVNRYLEMFNPAERESISNTDFKKLINFRIKPSFRNHILLTSENDIIANNIVADAKNVANKIVLNYSNDAKNILGGQDGWVFSDTPNTLSMAADDSILEEHLRVKMVSEPNVYSARVAQRYAIGHLMRELKEIYKGNILAIGDPKVKPYDRVFIADHYNDIFGTIDVREVVHMFSPETGYIMDITPDLCVTNNEFATIAEGQALSIFFSELTNLQTYAGPIIVATDKAGTAVVDGAIKKTYNLARKNETISKAIDGIIEGYGKFETKFASKGAVEAAVKAYDLAWAKESTAKAGEKALALARLKGTEGLLLTAGKEGLVKKLATIAPALAVSWGLLCLMDGGMSMIRYAQGRNPVIIQPLIRQGRPFIVGLEGYKLDGWITHMRQSWEHFWDDFDAGWEAIKDNFFAARLDGSRAVTQLLSEWGINLTATAIAGVGGYGLGKWGTSYAIQKAFKNVPPAWAKGLGVVGGLAVGALAADIAINSQIAGSSNYERQ